jgi:hypothetical protein
MFKDLLLLIPYIIAFIIYSVIVFMLTIVFTILDNFIKCKN